MILPVNAIKVSNLSWTSNSAVQKDAATNSDIANNDKKHLSTGLKAGLALGGLAVVGAGVYLATRGKKNLFKLTSAQQKELQKLIDDGKIDSDTAAFFTDLYETGAFADIPKMYNKLTKFMGYEKAPELIINPEFGETGFAMYNFVNGTVSVGTKGNLSEMYHELIHFGQFDYLYRGFGKDGIIDARTIGILNELKLDGEFRGGKASQRIFGKPFDKVTDTEFEEFIAKKRAQYSEDFNESFYQQVAASQGELSEGAREKAELYRQALMASDRNQSLLEKEAYGKQIKFNKKLSDFISIVKP